MGTEHPSPTTKPGRSVLLGIGVARMGMPHLCDPRRCRAPCQCWKPVPMGLVGFF